MAYTPKVVRVTELLDEDNRVLYEFLPPEILAQIQTLQNNYNALLAAGGISGSGASTSTFTYAPNDLNYTFIQQNPSKIWNVNHNLNKYPTVGIYDTAGTELMADITIIDKNNLQIMFENPVAGTAACN